MASPRRKQFPRLALIGLAWLLVIDVLTLFQVGPISASGLLTLGTAGLCLVALPLFLLEGQRMPATEKVFTREGAAIPWALTAFLVLAWVRLYFAPSVEGMQNVAVYTAFIAGAGLISLWAPPRVVVNTLRTYRLAAVLVPLVFLAGLAVGLEVYGERAFALASLVLLAVLIPYRGRRLVYTLGPVLIVAAMFLSLSRSAAVIGAALLVFTAVRSRKRYRFARAAVFAGAVGAGLYWAVTSYAPFRDRFLGGDQAVSVGGLNFNTSGRSTLWEITTESAATAPWFGHGPGSSNELISGLFENISHPHNDYLRLYHDFGIIGAALFTMGMLLLLRRVWQRARRTDDQIHWAAVVALLGVLAAALTDNVIVYPFVMVPLSVIVGCSLAQPLPPPRPKRRRLIGLGPAHPHHNPAIPSGYNFQRPKQTIR